MTMKPTLLTGLTTLALAVSVSAQSVGLNFVDGWPTPMLQGETADGCSLWTDSVTGFDQNQQATSTTLLGTAITARWNSANTWAAGTENDSEQQLYRVYLDDGDGGSTLVVGDGIGVSVTLTGLSQYQGGYSLRLYGSSDTGFTVGSFQPISVRLGAPNPGDGDNQLLNLSVLDTVTVNLLGNGGYPTGDAGGIRGYGDSIWLTADTVTLTIPARSGDIRGTLAGLQIVPEPSSMALLALGVGALFVARARRS
jgi:hypothetical protein